jgi:PAS domain S-box-containing protein
LDISILKSVVPGVVSMKVNTALCFVLSGFTLWILNEEKQNSLKKMCSIVFPSIMILIGLLTLGEYLLEINFGIDEFLFKEETRATATSDPGRMAPISAICFILSGMSLLLLYKNKAFQMFQLLSLAVFALALLTLIGYAYAVNDLQGGMASFTKMAIHTSVAFVFLSVGVLFSKSDKGIMYIFTNDGIAGITTRKLLPVIIFTPLILGWLRLIGQQAGYYNTELGVALFSFTTILVLVVVVFGISGTLLAIDNKRKNAENHLKEFEHFFNINHDLCGIANTEGYFELINANFTRILGYTEKEFCETAFIELIHPDDIPATVQEYEKLKLGALVINFVNRYRKKDGSYLYLDWNATPNPATQKLYCVARDITERKKAEEELRAVNKELESFSYSVSHDLRAPLRAINGYAQILNEDYGQKLDQEGMRFLETIQSNATKMGTLIDDLLAFSRLGRKEIQKTEVEMNQLIESVINETNKSITHKAKINTAHLHKVKADYNLLHQVMFNLVSNAIKYSSKGENPVVRISSEEKNGNIVFSVNDNGVGFDMQYSDKLFGVFQRLHSYEEFKGTGVGLAIVQRIITKHGGKVWAEGIVNKGATFHFSLTKN